MIGGSVNGGGAGGVGASVVGGGASVVGGGASVVGGGGGGASDVSGWRRRGLCDGYRRRRRLLSDGAGLGRLRLRRRRRCGRGWRCRGRGRRRRGGGSDGRGGRRRRRGGVVAHHEKHRGGKCREKHQHTGDQSQSGPAVPRQRSRFVLIRFVVELHLWASVVGEAAAVGDATVLVRVGGRDIGNVIGVRPGQRAEGARRGRVLRVDLGCHRGGRGGCGDCAGGRGHRRLALLDRAARRFESAADRGGQLRLSGGDDRHPEVFGQCGGDDRDAGATSHGRHSDEISSPNSVALHRFPVRRRRSRRAVRGSPRRARCGSAARRCGARAAQPPGR